MDLNAPDPSNGMKNYATMSI